MLKSGFRYIVLFLFLSMALNASAQLYQYGIHFGYNLSKYKVKSTQPAEGFTAINGRSKGGGTFGIQFLYGPPKEQSIRKFHIIPTILVELSACYCGGRLLTSTPVTDSIRTIRELEFTQVQVDFSPKFMARMNNIHFLVGPTITKMFSAELDLTGTDAVFDASGYYNPIIIGYETGIGYQLKTINFSARYQANATAFGKETLVLPTDFKNRQFRFMIQYFFLQKHRGSYLDTIYW